MKKLLSITTMIALAFAIPMSSCNKRSELTDSNLNDGRASIWNQGIEINKKYRLAKSTNQPLTNASNNNGVRAAVVVGADATTLGAGMTTLTPMWALGPFGIIGSVLISGLGAAAASITGYHGVHRIGNSPNVWASQVAEANAALSNYQVLAEDNPFDNPYDSVGVRHNQLVKIYYTTANNAENDPKTLLFSPTNLSSEEVAAVQNNSTTGMYNIVQYLYDHPITDDASFLAYVNNAHTVAGTSTFLRGFSDAFVDGLLNCNTFAEIIELVHDYEQVYVPYTGFSDGERAYVLGTLATAKYSAVLWNYIYTH